MNWYYVEAGQQSGPVDDATLQQMAAAGRITTSTLVWREGMGEWQPYGQVSGPAPATATPPALGGADQVACAECGRVFNRQETIAYGTVNVCATCKPVFLQKLAEGTAIKTGALNYAGFWIRFAAKFIDGLILAPFILVPYLFLMFKAGAEDMERLQIVNGLAQLVFLCINMAYSVFFLGKYGATPGKMACKIKVVTAEGGPISYGRAFGRFFAEMLSGIICYIGYIMVGFDGEKRGLHDRICNTRVIYK